MTTLAGRRRDERGQALPLALLFLAGISVMVIALLGRSFTSETTTVVLRQTLNTQYAADAAVSESIARLRDPASNVFAPSSMLVQACPGQPTSLASGVGINSVPIRADCVWIAPTAPGVPQVAVVIMACPLSLPVGCPGAALLRASVTFTQQTSGPLATITNWAVLYGGT